MRQTFERGIDGIDEVEDLVSHGGVMMAREIIFFRTCQPGEGGEEKILPSDVISPNHFPLGNQPRCHHVVSSDLGYRSQIFR